MISDVYLLLHPIDPYKQHDIIEQMHTADKQRKLDNFEQERLKRHDKGKRNFRGKFSKLAIDEEEPGFFSRLGLNIAENVQIEINRVHIRIENNVSSAKVCFLCFVSIFVSE